MRILFNSSESLKVGIYIDRTNVRLEFYIVTCKTYHCWIKIANYGGVAIFVLDVYLKDKTGFSFLDTIEDKFPMAHEDTILITGKASDEVVNACLASDISYLLEKPVKPYALQLAIRAIVAKYIKFAKRLLLDTSLAESVSKF